MKEKYFGICKKDSMELFFFFMQFCNKNFLAQI